MQRRGFLRGLAGLTAVAAGAGCTSNNREVPPTAPAAPVDDAPTRTPEPGGTDGPGDDGTGTDGAEGEPETADAGPTATPKPVVNDSIELLSDDAGDLVLAVTVRNVTAVEQSAHVTGVVSLDGETYEADGFTAAPADGTATVRLTYPVEREAVIDRGGFEVDIRRRTPATPLPTSATET